MMGNEHFMTSQSLFNFAKNEIPNQAGFRDSFLETKEMCIETLFILQKIIQVINLGMKILLYFFRECFLFFFMFFLVLHCKKIQSGSKFIKYLNEKFTLQQIKILSEITKKLCGLPEFFEQEEFWYMQVRWAIYFIYEEVSDFTHIRNSASLIIQCNYDT